MAGRVSSSPKSFQFIRAPRPLKSFQDVDDLITKLVTAIDTALKQVRNDIAGGAIYTTSYFGDPNTNGSWRIKISGDELVAERREAGAWVEKGSFTAT